MWWRLLRLVVTNFFTNRGFMFAQKKITLNTCSVGFGKFARFSVQRRDSGANNSNTECKHNIFDSLADFLTQNTHFFLFCFDRHHFSPIAAKVVGESSNNHFSMALLSCCSSHVESASVHGEHRRFRLVVASSLQHTHEFWKIFIFLARETLTLSRASRKEIIFYFIGAFHVWFPYGI